VLTITEMLRKAKVVGKFVEFFGEGTASLSVTDRATIANMAPEYGATMGFFPVDDKTIEYFRGTGRTDEEIDAFAAYFKAQQMYGIPKAGQIDYSQQLELDLSTVMPSLAGPKRPQDRINLDNVKSTFSSLFSKPVGESGFAKPAAELAKRHETHFGGSSPVSGGGKTSLGSQKSGAPADVVEMVDNRAIPVAVTPARVEYGKISIGHGDVLIAAITSCTNTSNPGVSARRGIAGEEGGRARPQREAPRQDLARARIAGRDGVPHQDRTAALPRKARVLPRRIRLHYVHRKLRAAGTVDRGDGREKRSGVCCGALREPQLRGAHPRQHPRQFPRLAAARGRLCNRRLGAERPPHRAAG
jgi:hypothetical protein